MVFCGRNPNKLSQKYSWESIYSTKNLWKLLQPLNRCSFRWVSTDIPKSLLRKLKSTGELVSILFNSVIKLVAVEEKRGNVLRPVQCSVPVVVNCRLLILYGCLHGVRHYFKSGNTVESNAARSMPAWSFTLVGEMDNKHINT